MTTTKKDPYEYFNCTVHKMVDGDTVYFNLERKFTIDVDFGFNIFDSVVYTKTAVQDFRFARINAPEVKGASKVKGLEATAALEHLLSLGTIRLLSLGPDNYGRWLCECFVTPADGVEFNVNDKMVELGMAVPYMV